MIISLIAAMSKNRVIGRGNSIPWNIPSDQQRFRDITIGHPIILGRRTFETLGHPLPGRKNIVLTRNKDYQSDGIVIAHNLPAAFAACEDADEVFVCGGGIVFRETVSLASRIYLTVIHKFYDGDVFFPHLPPHFTVVKSEDIDNDPPYTFFVYEAKIDPR